MKRAAVAVTVATLWAAPDQTRPSDAAALRDEPDIGAWIAAMTPGEQIDSGVVTQLLLGDRVLVDEVRPDGWARVVAPGQPAPGLDARGYPGWMRAAQLAEVPGTAEADGAALVVDAVSTALHDAPAGRVVLPGVVLGTLLTPAAAAGAADGSAAGSAAGAAGCGAAGGGWLAVCVAGRQAPLWVRSGDLAPVPAGPPSGDEALAVARRLHGAAYVWGGLSTLGIDCSGLIHLAWRRLGVRLPRDAHDQSAATTPVPRGGERPGDLYFFARPGARPHHVGIVVTPAAGTTPGRMLHASQAQHRVVEEPMPPERAATLVGVRRP